MRYGKTASAVVLEQLVDKDSHSSRVVGSIIQDFNMGLKILSLIKDKRMYESFRIVWTNECRKRIDDSNLPNNIKNYLTTTVVGLSNQHFRKTMIENNWVSKTDKYELLSREKLFEKHYNDAVKNRKITNGVY
jgi:hypothetical protein